MRTVVWGVSGIALGVAYVFVIGSLSIQVTGRRLGAVLDLKNEIVSVSPPTVPIVPMLGIAVVSGLVMYVLTAAVRALPRVHRLAWVVGFALTVLALVALSWLGPADRFIDPDRPRGMPAGWQGSFEQGGDSPAVHVLLLFAIGSAWLYPGSRGGEAPKRNRKPVEIELEGRED